MYGVRSEHKDQPLVPPRILSLMQTPLSAPFRFKILDLNFQKPVFRPSPNLLQVDTLPTRLVCAHEAEKSIARLSACGCAILL
jgi:hypothetical protein